MTTENKIKLACAIFIVYAFFYLIFSLSKPIYAALFWANLYGMSYYLLRILAKKENINNSFIVILTKSSLLAIGVAQVYDSFSPISKNYFACYAVGLTAFIFSLAWHYRLKKKS